MQVQGVLTIFFDLGCHVGESVLFFSNTQSWKVGTFKRSISERTTAFANIYPLDSDLSGGWHYPAFEQLLAALLCKDRILKWASPQTVLSSATNNNVTHNTIGGTILMPQ